MATGPGAAGETVVLFDGPCGLCNAAVRFVIEHDRQGRFRFASLQSHAAVRLLAGLDRAGAPGQAESLLLVEGTEVHSHSDAALRIARRLDGAWPLLHGLVVVPRALRDAVYRAVARRRHRWPGGTHGCRVPGPEHAGRFLP
jgi:predicted DCC family thiol-disulfide oxidoreductase YuxK